MTASTDGRANGLAIYFHQIKFGDLFVLNKWSDIHMPEKLIEIFTTSILFYLKKITKMTGLHIRPTAENDNAAIPPPIFFLTASALESGIKVGVH